MKRLVIITVGKTHSGKTTFAKELEQHLHNSLMIDQDNHAEFIIAYYKSLLPEHEPYTIKYAVTQTIVDYAVNQTNFHLILCNSNRARKGRLDLVAQFQNDPAIKTFLISLKAGGVGLNLTAADYVYLVDPWWNPATEDQAIDRTHRIGQTKKVFAYKMICKETVEEKILQLQQKKKFLSKELISEEKSFIKKLTKNDVQFLFS